MRRRPVPFRSLVIALGLNPLQGFVRPLLPEGPCGNAKRAVARPPVASRCVVVRMRQPKSMPSAYGKSTSAEPGAAFMVARGNYRLMFVSLLLLYIHDETDPKSRYIGYPDLRASRDKSETGAHRSLSAVIQR